MFIDRDVSGAITAVYANAQHAGQEFVEGAVVSTPLKTLAQAALNKTSVTVERIVEASALNPTVRKMTNQDVLDFMLYRKSLRDIVSGVDTTSTVLPPAPGTVGGIPFPAGT